MHTALPYSPRPSCTHVCFSSCQTAKAVQLGSYADLALRPLQLASAWWGNRIKALQRAAGLSKKQVNGLTVLEAVPGAVGYWWPVEAAHRLLGSGGQGFVC